MEKMDKEKIKKGNMKMSKQYQIKQIKTNERGYKVTTTIATKDEEVIKQLIDSEPQKKASKNNTNSKTSKKGVVIDAEVTEVKTNKKKTTSKTSKKNQPKVSAKALPSPSQSSDTTISLLRQKIKVENACFALLKTNPKIKYLGHSDRGYSFMYYRDMYHFASLPNAVKDFLNYKVWFEAGEVKTKKLSGQPKIKPKPKHPATKPKKVESRINSNSYEFYNNKGEHVKVVISKETTDPKNKNSLPNQWAKAGYIKKPIYNYLHADVYVTDEEGNCWGRYNPQHGDTHHLNFKWLLEATSENEKKILNEVYRLANL